MGARPQQSRRPRRGDVTTPLKSCQTRAYRHSVSLVSISRKLSKRVSELSFSDPVAFVYNPLDYARAPAEQYLKRYGAAPKQVVMLGMNPGPFGMAQTGVPFGEVASVRDWLGITGKVNKPPVEHPKRPITGFDCQRSEVSGARLWGWARERFRTPDRFFDRFFVVNYCPLVFMGDTGKNLTPDKLPKAEREPLIETCDEALRATIRELQPELVVGVGVFAQKRAQTALTGLDVGVAVMLHPSPASPKANRGWAPAAEADLRRAGVRLS